jgi:hypothetical protein
MVNSSEHLKNCLIVTLVVCEKLKYLKHIKVIIKLLDCQLGHLRKIPTKDDDGPSGMMIHNLLSSLPEHSLLAGFSSEAGKFSFLLQLSMVIVSVLQL